MPRRRNDSDTDASSIAFLDVISCGFGAMVLLLIITDSTPPASIESALVPQEAPILDLQQQLFEIRGETTVVNRDLNAKREQLSAYEERIANLQREHAHQQQRPSRARAGRLPVPRDCEHRASLDDMVVVKVYSKLFNPTKVPPLRWVISRIRLAKR